MNTSSEESTQHTALRLFEEFLIEHHEQGAEIETLCEKHPDHAARLRLWWDQLENAGEVGCGTSQNQPLPESGDTFGDYAIQAEVGHGSQGVVFRAVDSRTDRHVAIKLLTGHRAHGHDARARFAREAKLAAKLDHPGLCSVLAHGEIEGRAYLAMPFIAGRTLADHLAESRRRGEPGPIHIGADTGSETEASPQARIDAVLELFAKVADALDSAHGTPLIHRDIKPANILVSPDGQGVILDFGLARDTSSMTFTLTGDLVGTPAYMSPEQLVAQRIELDHRTDIYSLGATLYECLTLQRPFVAPTRSELYHRILTAAPTPVSQLCQALPSSLDAVLGRTLEKDREHRYTTAADLASDLRRIRRGEAIATKPPSRATRLWRWASRNPFVAASLTVVFLTLSIGLAVSLYFQSESERSRAAFDQLASRGRLSRTRAAAQPLLPVHPERVSDLEAWLAEANSRKTELASLHAAVSHLREQATRTTAAERDLDPHILAAREELSDLETELQQVEKHGNAPAEMMQMVTLQRTADLTARIRAARTELARLGQWRFPRMDQSVAHDALIQLIEEFEEFTGPSGMLTRMALRLDLARTLQATPVDTDAWREVREQVARDYGGRILKPQVGLHPLGKSPEGWQEFALIGSGEVPRRDPKTDRLICTGSTAIVFVLVPGGSFRMGISAGQLRQMDRFLTRNGGQGAARKAVPTHSRFAKHVELDWFFLAKHELTNGQWHRLLGWRPDPGGIAKAADQLRDEFPVDRVTWQLSDRLLREVGLDLPTEAQWEFAARGGATTPWWWGVRQPSGPPHANLRDRSMRREMAMDVGGEQYDDGVAALAPAASFPPNGFGLHHVTGNVAEWCRDRYVPYSLAQFEARAGDGLHEVPSAALRAFRGGAYLTPVLQSALVRRSGRPDSLPQNGVGVRPMRRVE